MTDALSGSLEQLPLHEILRLLLQGSKTGHLSLNNETDAGDVYVSEGRIVHAVAGIEYGESALWEMIFWLRGRFNFQPEVPSPDETMHRDTATLLLEAERRYKDLQTVRSEIPDDLAAFQLSPSGTQQAISLQPMEWQVLAHVDGSRNALEIARQLNLEKLEALKVLAHLKGIGLLVVTSAPVQVPIEVIGAEFFTKLREEFTNLMGPIGPIIIDEAVDEMGLSTDNFPRDRVADLIEKISHEIEDDDKRLHFQQIMLELLRSF